MHLALQVVATAQALQKGAQRVFRPLGLTPVQFNVLNVLARRPEGMRASDLARTLIVDPSNVTGLLKRMKQAGLLSVVENPRDRRQHVVTLNAKGRAAWAAGFRVYQRGLAALDSGIGPRERNAAERALRRLTSGVDALQ